MKKILTGLQPTGVITLGNYIGAIKQMVEHQDEYESYIFVADLHSLTVLNDDNNIKENTRSLLALYLACGIDPNKNIMFVQSDNEYHTSLSWILECHTYFGELSRMHQFKEKSKKSSNFSAGLFTYPVLMAADILLYDIDLVPVGIDQKQHVEIARDIAIRFNKKYGDTFKVPDCLITKSGTKIMDLVNPDKKMSKSAENKKGVIYLLDSEKDIRKKIMSATTDSDMLIKYDKDNKPGVSNLISIYSALKNISIEEVEKEFAGCNYGTFKKCVADLVVDVTSKIQDKYNEILNSDIIDKILDHNIDKVRKIAKEKYELVKNKISIGR